MALSTRSTHKSTGPGVPVVSAIASMLALHVHGVLFEMLIKMPSRCIPYSDNGDTALREHVMDGLPWRNRLIGMRFARRFGCTKCAASCGRWHRTHQWALQSLVGSSPATARKCHDSCGGNDIAPTHPPEYERVPPPCEVLPLRCDSHQRPATAPRWRRRLDTKASEMSDNTTE